MLACHVLIEIVALILLLLLLILMYLVPKHVVRTIWVVAWPSWKHVVLTTHWAQVRITRSTHVVRMSKSTQRFTKLIKFASFFAASAQVELANFLLLI